MGLVLGGCFKLVCHAADGRSVIVGLRNRGWLLGAAAALAARPSQAAAVAITMSRMQLVSRRAFLLAVGSCPDLASHVLHMHAVEICRFTSDVEAHASLTADMRLRRLLAELSHDSRAPQSSSEFAGIQVPLTHDEIAQTIGSTREHVTRLVRQLERDGAIRQDRGWIHLRKLRADERTP